MALPDQYRPLQVEYPFTYPVKSPFIHLFSRNRRKDLAFNRGVTYIVTRCHMHNRPQEVAEDQAFFGILAILDLCCSQGFPLIGGEIGCEFASPEPLGDLTEYLSGNMRALHP